MKKGRRWIVAALCLSLLSGGCAAGNDADNVNVQNTKEDEKKETAPEKLYQARLDVIEPAAYGNADGLPLEKGAYISIIGKSEDGQYWKEVQRGAKQAEEDLNSQLGYTGKDKVKVTYIAPAQENSVDEQVNILDEELARYPVALAISIVDEQACGVQFDLASDSGIPVVAFDSGSDYQGLMATVSTDNTESASVAADRLAEQMSASGEVVIFAHDSKSKTAKEREGTFENQIRRNYSGITIADIYYMDDLKPWQEAIAAEMDAGTYQRGGEEPGLLGGEEVTDPESITEEEVIDYVLSKHPDLKGCYGTSGDAVKAIVHGLDRIEKEDVMVVGFDADDEQIEMLRDGKVDGLVVQNPFGMGYAAVIAASRAALSLGNEAYIDTGYVWVTKENLEDKDVQKMLSSDK